MKKATGVIVASMFAIVVVAFPAQAVVVEDFGSIYTLTISQVSGLNYHAVPTIDTSGFTGPLEYRHISAVSFKVTNDIASVTLTDAPGGNWSTREANLSNNLCAEGGRSGFVCNQAELPFDASSGIYKWEWDLALAHGSQIFPELIGVHIGAEYNNASGTFSGWIPSGEVAAPVPESSTLLLLGSGLLGLGGFTWGRNRKD